MVQKHLHCFVHLSFYRLIRSSGALFSHFLGIKIKKKNMFLLSDLHHVPHLPVRDGVPFQKLPKYRHCLAMPVFWIDISSITIYE